jgi:hypothetical protein
LISDAPKVGRVAIYKREKVDNMLVPANMLRFQTIHKISVSGIRVREKGSKQVRKCIFNNVNVITI